LELLNLDQDFVLVCHLCRRLFLEMAILLLPHCEPAPPLSFLLPGSLLPSPLHHRHPQGVPLPFLCVVESAPQGIDLRFLVIGAWL
jgi:hypothetical protein